MTLCSIYRAHSEIIMILGGVFLLDVWAGILWYNEIRLGSLVIGIFFIVWGYTVFSPICDASDFSFLATYDLSRGYFASFWWKKIAYQVKLYYIIILYMVGVPVKCGFPEYKSPLFRFMFSWGLLIIFFASAISDPLWTSLIPQTYAV